VLEIAPADWSRAFAVNVMGAYLMSRAVLPAMIEAGGGSIIHIGSQLGRVGAPGRPAYCASKGAIIQLAKAMAIDHAAQNIRVNALSPGAVETGRLLRRYGNMETARREAGPKHLLNRLGLPAEIAQAALFLASDAFELHDRRRHAGRWRLHRHLSGGQNHLPRIVGAMARGSRVRQAPTSTAWKKSARCWLKAAGSSRLMAWPAFGHDDQRGGRNHALHQQAGSRHDQSSSPVITSVGTVMAFILSTRSYSDGAPLLHAAQRMRRAFGRVLPS